MRRKGVPDHGVIAIASQTGRALLTFNRQDFIRLHNSGIVHRGIIVCTRDPDIAALAARTDAAIGATACLDGQLLRVCRPS